MLLSQVASLFLYLTLNSVVGAFTATTPNAVPSLEFSTTIRQRPVTTLAAASIDAEENKMSKEDRLQLKEEWMAQLESDQVQEVRTELIAKYVSQGSTVEFATVEVDKFLSDPERSLEYMEMRRYAKEQNELGFEGALQYGAFFLIGLLGNVGANYYSAMQDGDHNMFQMFH